MEDWMNVLRLAGEDTMMENLQGRLSSVITLVYDSNPDLFLVKSKTNMILQIVDVEGDAS